MVVFSNHRLGPSAEILVSNEVASAMLRETAEAARYAATSRWEQELVRWLEQVAISLGKEIDVSDIAWTPDHFDAQQEFLAMAIGSAATQSRHMGALSWWRNLVAAHPRECVQFGRRWSWPTISATT